MCFDTESRSRVMGIEMEDLPDQMSLSALADRCISEIQHYRRHEPYNDRYCLEIFHRAMVRHDPQAWELLQQRFTPTVKAWMRNHPHRDIACRHQSEERSEEHTSELQSP